MTEVTNADLDSLIAMARGYGFVHWIGTESKQPTSFSFQFDDFVAMVRALSLPHKAMHALAPGSQVVAGSLFVAERGAKWSVILSLPDSKELSVGDYGYKEAADSYLAQFATPPPARIASAEEDARDANRYRWLRDYPEPESWGGAGWQIILAAFTGGARPADACIRQKKIRAEELDTAIDAALSSGEKGGTT